MMQDMHIEGGSLADYYLEAYNMTAQIHDDDVSGTEQYHSFFGRANNDINSGVSDAAEEDSAASSSSSHSSCTEWFKTVSLSSIWEVSPPSQDDDDDDNDDDELFGPDPAMQLIPVDYSKDRENHRKRAAGHTNPTNPWVFAEYSKQQCLSPNTESLSNESDARVEAYRGLLGKEPPPPPRAPITPPEFQYYQYHAPPRLINGRWWRPPPTWHLVTPRPSRREPPKETTPETPSDDSIWAKIPCECWHCVAHAYQEVKTFKPLFDWRKRYVGEVHGFSLPR